MNSQERTIVSSLVVLMILLWLGFYGIETQHSQAVLLDLAWV